MKEVGKMSSQYGLDKLGCRTCYNAYYRA